MGFPKYILRRYGFFQYDVLEFNRLIPDRDIAEYGRLKDRGTVSWRTFEMIMNKHDVFYWGKND